MVDPMVKGVISTVIDSGILSINPFTGTLRNSVAIRPPFITPLAVPSVRNGKLTRTSFPGKTSSKSTCTMRSVTG